MPPQWLSNTATEQPSWARRYAASEPVMPLPRMAMSTSISSSSGAGEGSVPHGPSFMARLNEPREHERTERDKRIARGDVVEAQAEQVNDDNEQDRDNDIGHRT